MQINFCITAADPRVRSHDAKLVQIHKVYPRDLTVQNTRCMKLHRARNSQMKGKQSLKCSRSRTAYLKKIPPLCCLSNQYNRCNVGLLPFWICCPLHNMLIVLMVIPYPHAVKTEEVHRAHGSLCKTRQDEQAFKNPIFHCSYIITNLGCTPASSFNINLCFCR